MWLTADLLRLTPTVIPTCDGFHRSAASRGKEEPPAVGQRLSSHRETSQDGNVLGTSPTYKLSSREQVAMPRLSLAAEVGELGHSKLESRAPWSRQPSVDPTADSPSSQRNEQIRTRSTRSATGHRSGASEEQLAAAVKMAGVSVDAVARELGKGQPFSPTTSTARPATDRGSDARCSPGATPS
jgi:hypothetical protein